MRHTFAALLAAVTLIFSAAGASALPEIGQPAPSFSGADFNGGMVKLSDYAGKIVVLEWHNPGCPFVRKHYDSGNMQSLQKYAVDKGIIWLTVNSASPGKEGYMQQADAKEFFRQHPANFTHYLLDPEGIIGRRYGAKSTPHMFVIDAKGNIAYMGAIDNKPTPDPASLRGADNYVRDAIDSLLARTPVAISSTQSYGCSVKYAE